MPRLELNAARLADIIRDMIVQQSGEHYDRIFMFTDRAKTIPKIITRAKNTNHAIVFLNCVFKRLIS